MDRAVPEMDHGKSSCGYRQCGRRRARGKGDVHSCLVVGLVDRQAYVGNDDGRTLQPFEAQEGVHDHIGAGTAQMAIQKIVYIILNDWYLF